MNQKTNSDGVIAFLLILTSGDQTENVLNQLKKLAEVVEAYIIYGDWDLIVKVKIASLPELTRMVMKLRKTEGVEKTSTLITI